MVSFHFERVSDTSIDLCEVLSTSSRNAALELASSFTDLDVSLSAYVLHLKVLRKGLWSGVRSLFG